MEKLKKYKEGILVGGLLLASVLAVILGKTIAIQGGIACLCWGLAVFVCSYIAKKRGDQQIIEFDAEVTAVLEDIANNGEDSEYYGLLDIEIANKTRKKLIKRIKKQIIGCVILGVILIITSILCMFQSNICKKYIQFKLAIIKNVCYNTFAKLNKENLNEVRFIKKRKWSC